MILKLTFDPDSLRTEVTSLRDSLLSAMDRGDASSLQGFLTSYGFLCDFFGVPFNNEVAWVCWVLIILHCTWYCIYKPIMIFIHSWGEHSKLLPTPCSYPKVFFVSLYVCFSVMDQLI